MEKELMLKVKRFIDDFKLMTSKDKETAAAHRFFLELCHLIGFDYNEALRFDELSFEETCHRPGCAKPGRADVFLRGRFVWEFKKVGSDLDKAYAQALLYRDSLNNPPFTICCNFKKISIYTHEINEPQTIITLTLDDLLLEDNLDILKYIFGMYESFPPPNNETLEEVENEEVDSTTTDLSVADNEINLSEEQAEIERDCFGRHKVFGPNERFKAGVQSIFAHDMHVEDTNFSNVMKSGWPVLADDSGSYWRKNWIRNFNSSLQEESLECLHSASLGWDFYGVIPFWMRIDSFALGWRLGNTFLKELSFQDAGLNDLKFAITAEGKSILLGSFHSSSQTAKEILKNIWEKSRPFCRKHARQCAELVNSGIYMADEVFPKIDHSFGRERLGFGASFQELSEAIFKTSEPRLKIMEEFPQAEGKKLVSPMSVWSKL